MKNKIEALNMTSPWIVVKRPYDGRQLALWYNTIKGTTSVLFTNKWHESHTPRYNNTILALVNSMREELALGL